MFHVKHFYKKYYFLSGFLLIILLLFRNVFNKVLIIYDIDILIDGAIYDRFQKGKTTPFR